MFEEVSRSVKFLLSTDLQFIPPGRRDEQTEHVDHVRHEVLGLSHAHSLHDHVIVAAHFAQGHGLVGGTGHAAQVTAIWTGTDVGLESKGNN